MSYEVQRDAEPFFVHPSKTIVVWMDGHSLNPVILNGLKVNKKTTLIRGWLLLFKL